MGIYAQFWHCHPAGLAEEFLAGPLDEFDAWCVETVTESPGDIDTSVYLLLQLVQAHGRTVLSATSETEANAVDRLLDAYFGRFCDLRRQDLKKRADGSLLRARSYRNLFGLSRESSACSAAFDLWNYLFTGRAVGRDAKVLPYKSEDGVYHLSFWSPDEVILLDRALATSIALSEDEFAARAAATNALANARKNGAGLFMEIA